MNDRGRPLLNYLQAPKRLVDGEVYHQTADDFILKSLGLDQTRLDMTEVHEGIMVHTSRLLR